MTIQRAAAAIAALINSRPTSPGEAEIAEILRGMGSLTAGLAMSPEHAGHYAGWRQLIEAHVRDFGGSTWPSDAEVEALEARMGEHMDEIDGMVDLIHLFPARTWGDVLLYAEVCCWYSWPGRDPEGAEVRAVMPAGPECMGGMHDVSLVKLIEAIFIVAGITKAAESG